MATQLTQNQIISLLRAEKSYLTKEFGVVNIGLFGSFARGEENESSDIDLVVEIANMILASRAYEANVTVMKSTKQMAMKALEIGR